MIKTENLTKQYDDFLAVKDVSLAVAEGELLALLGPNGAGKTSTIRMISSLLAPTSGRAWVNGYDVVTQAAAVRRSIGMLTEQPGLYERMSGLEYLQFYGQLYGMSPAEIESRGSHLFERFGMPKTAHRRLSGFSKGMKQKVGLIRAMLHYPSVLLLDEPTSAMDPHSAKLVRESIEEMRSDSRAIILCTHNLAEAERLADRIAIISAGEIVAAGTAVELKRQLLGPPLMEITLDRSLNGEVHDLEQLVVVESTSGSSFRYRASNPHQTNPTVVRFLSGLGLGVVTLTHIEQSLEEVYLQVVSAQPDLLD